MADDITICGHKIETEEINGVKVRKYPRELWCCSPWSYERDQYWYDVIERNKK